MKRDPNDPAKLLLEPVPGMPGPVICLFFQPGDPMQPQWAGQESVAFPDNWSIGLSFLHNLFAREHNSFVDEFRKEAAQKPNADSGLRDPADPKRVIHNKDVTPDELFEAARLVVAAEIAKIHTTEWTPQLLYDEPLYKGMNANWNGLLGTGDPDVSKALSDIIVHDFGKSKDVEKASQWYSVLASGPGIFGLGSKVSHYDITNPEDTNGGVNHFGSPFNFPEEFVTVYRLHALIPDLLEYRDLCKDPNQIAQKVAVINTFEGKATDAMRSRGLANWGLSLGRQRLGLLTLHNIPQFMQNIRLPRLDSPTQQIDIAALDIIRDRERGVPRFNEFRRQYGLRQLTSFDDFTDKSLPPDSPPGRIRKHRPTASRGLWHACMRLVESHHGCAGKRRWHADQRLSRPSEWIGGGQHRGCGHRRRLDGGIGSAARVRDFGDAVCRVHSQCFAEAVQRSFLHVEFPAGILYSAGYRLGESQRPRAGNDGAGNAERT